MPEYYEKYRQVQRINTTKSIDSPVFYLWNMTLYELGAGLICFGIAMYLSGSIPSLGILTLIGSFFLPLLLRWIRVNVPRKTAWHIMWIFLGVGFNPSTKYTLKKPKKRILGP